LRAASIGKAKDWASCCSVAPSTVASPARKQVAAYALLVDAKDEAAKRFYRRFGFVAMRDADLTLYLPLGR
jgi:hypothetical protein